MDTLIIKGMKFHAFHGVHNYEKEKGNDFEVDVIAEGDFTSAGSSDDINKAVDYSVIHTLVKEVINGPSANLIEHLCFLIGDRISSQIESLSEFVVVVRKLNPPLNDHVDFTEVRMKWPR